MACRFKPNHQFNSNSYFDILFFVSVLVTVKEMIFENISPGTSFWTSRLNSISIKKKDGKKQMKWNSKTFHIQNYYYSLFYFILFIIQHMHNINNNNNDSKLLMMFLSFVCLNKLEKKNRANTGKKNYHHYYYI